MRPAVEPCEEALALALDPAWRLRGARAEVPHLTYIPEGWNGRLVFGEAQSLSKGTKPPSYVEAVLGMAAAGNLAGLAKRLWHSAGGDDVVCVAPWHSGPIRIGLAARWPDEDVEAYGVSNAVPWATVDEHERNENPDTDVRLLARAFLARVIEIYGVREIVACGRVAQWVAAGLAPVVCFPSGSSRALASLVAKFTAGAVHPLELVGALPAHVRDRVHGRRIDDLLSAAYAAAAIAAPRRASLVRPSVAASRLTRRSSTDVHASAERASRSRWCSTTSLRASRLTRSSRRIRASRSTTSAPLSRTLRP